MLLAINEESVGHLADTLESGTATATPARHQSHSVFTHGFKFYFAFSILENKNKNF